MSLALDPRSVTELHLHPGFVSSVRLPEEVSSVVLGDPAAFNPIPTFSDRRDELAQWRDEDKSERVIDEAHFAAIKLRSWASEKGVYARLFDRSTTISLDNPWLFFNVEQLSDDPRLETAMSLLIAHATEQRASGKAGRRSITALDECWFLLDSPVLVPEVVQLFRTAGKGNASVWGISQTAEDFVGTEANPRVHGAGIDKNATTKIIGQQPGDMTAPRAHLHLNENALNQVKRFRAPIEGKSADALIVIGEKAETTHTIRMSPTPVCRSSAPARRLPPSATVPPISRYSCKSMIFDIHNPLCPLGLMSGRAQTRRAWRLPLKG